MSDFEWTEPAGKAGKIICAARDAFFEQGYDAVSMDEIAKRAGVAKQTVYSHYMSKDALFLAVAERGWHSLHSISPVPPGTTPATVGQALREMGLQLLELVLSPLALSLLRVTTAAAHRFPTLGNSVYQALVRHRISRLEDIIREVIDAGALRAENPHVAAEHISALIRGQLFLHCLLDPKFTPSREEMIEQVEQAVDCFLARYGVDADQLRAL
jgi:AcrR family transcriptional regulator